MAAKTLGTWVATDLVGANLSSIDTTLAFPLGTRTKARDMGTTAYGEGEFVYLAGGTSVAARSVVTIAADLSTVLIAARAIGAVALSQGAVDATTKYGWFQVLGKGVAASDSVSDAGPCYIDGTSGRIDDAAVAGDQIAGMRTASADDTNTCLVMMATYPSVGDYDNA